MFSQVVRGHTNAPAVVRRTLTRWAPTPGVTTITAGVTRDDRFIAVTTFETTCRTVPSGWNWNVTVPTVAALGMVLTGPS